MASGPSFLRPFQAKIYHKTLYECISQKKYSEETKRMSLLWTLARHLTGFHTMAFYTNCLSVALMTLHCSSRKVFSIKEDKV